MIYKTHIPVLKEKVIEYLNVKNNKNFIDCTFGEGGHSLEILKKNKPNGKVLGIEIDPGLFKKIEKIKKRFQGRLILVNDSYSNLEDIVERLNFKNVDGILFDLGMSMWQIKNSKRGFSFKNNEILDMRYNPDFTSLTAEKIVNSWDLKKIEKILKDFSQERFAKKIAMEIVNSRKEKRIRTTFDLIEVLRKALPHWYKRKRIHFATKTFQALRIAVNSELENLKKGLISAEKILKRGGRLVVISFHSQEDKIVKNFFKNNKNLKILTKKPIIPTKEEILKNLSSRSAKLRAAEKIA